MVLAVASTVYHGREHPMQHCREEKRQRNNRKYTQLDPADIMLKGNFREILAFSRQNIADLTEGYGILGTLGET